MRQQWEKEVLEKEKEHLRNEMNAFVYAEKWRNMEESLVCALVYALLVLLFFNLGISISSILALFWQIRTRVIN